MNWWVKKHKKVCTTVNYIDHFLILACTITGCISVSAFTCFIGIPIEITSFAIGLKVCVITAGIKKYKSIIQRTISYENNNRARIQCIFKTHVFLNNVLHIVFIKELQWFCFFSIEITNKHKFVFWIFI